MKKMINYLAASSLLVASSVYADGLGEIHNYSELLQPTEGDGKISITVSGTTNEQGYLYLPSYEDSKVNSYSAINGQIVKEPKVITIHGRDVLAYQFANGNRDVELQQTLSVEDLYKTKKAKIKYSHPGGVKRVSYKFINTSPVTIGKYMGQVSVPQGTELYGVVAPEWSKKKKTFEIKGLGDLKVVEVKRKKLSPGDEVKFKIRTYSPSPLIKWTLWTLVILLSAGLLWKRRDILNNLEPQTSPQNATAN